TFFFRMWFIMFILYRHFLPKGEPISAQTRHCPEFAVADYSLTQGSLCLHQPRLVNNPGYYDL
ncbi:MAG: hypothetical protein JW755_07225, partial [Candidatus Aminicenantes bacterium]|nr:hypothetical protein [Candidatus Aminicenantes bacterium]